MKILKQATLDRSNRKKDGSISMTFITSTEQSSEEFMDIDKATDQTGVLYFKTDGALTDKEVAEIDNTDLAVEGKSQSQKLRNAMYVYNKQNKNIDFKEYYKKETDRFIQWYLDKLI